MAPLLAVKMTCPIFAPPYSSDHQFTSFPQNWWFHPCNNHHDYWLRTHHLLSQFPNATDKRHIEICQKGREYHLKMFHHVSRSSHSSISLISSHTIEQSYFLTGNITNLSNTSSFEWNQLRVSFAECVPKQKSRSSFMLGETKSWYTNVMWSKDTVMV